MILCEGDSWTSGDMINPELKTLNVNHKDNDDYRLPKVWPYKLGKLLGVDILNTSMAGSSNDGIVRRVVSNVLDLLKEYDSKDIFVIVGWSSPERKDFYFNDGNDKYWETIFPNAINDIDQISDIEKERQEFYKTYLQYYWNEGDDPSHILQSFDEIQNILYRNGIRKQYRNYPSLGFQDWERA